MISRAAIWTGLAVLAGGVACGGGDSNSPDDGPRLYTVLVDNNTFQPATRTIDGGDTVVFSWVAGSIEHNIISFLTPNFTNKGTEVTPGNGTSEVDFFNAPESHTVVFNNPGRYWYYCSTHGNTDTTMAAMKGKIVVN